MIEILIGLTMLSAAGWFFFWSFRKRIRRKENQVRFTCSRCDHYDCICEKLED